MTLDLELLASLPELLMRLERRLELLDADGRDEILRTAGAARLLGIGENELRELARSGQIPSWEVGNGLKFSRQQLLAAFRQRAAENVRPSLRQVG